MNTVYPRRGLGMSNGGAYFVFEDGCESSVKDIVARSWEGFNSGFSPTLCDEGVGGTYFMHDSENNLIGVFKPHDEEMGSLHNPKGFTPGSASFTDNSAMRGVSIGEAAFRECVAYALDHGHFAGVPATDLVTCIHPSFNSSNDHLENVKIGSLQEYKVHDFATEDISPSVISQFPVHEVHKISILDIRLFNTDRHGGNILVHKKKIRNTYNGRNSKQQVVPDTQFSFDSDEEDEDYFSPDRHLSSSDEQSQDVELIPIDHGYALPTTVSVRSDAWFEWLNWPQAWTPFGPEEQRYINELDAEKDVTLLRQKFGDLISQSCFHVLRITTMWLKIATNVGLCPYLIGSTMCRKNSNIPSELEQMCVDAQQSVDRQHRGDRATATTTTTTTTTTGDLFFQALRVNMENTAAQKLHTAKPARYPFRR